MFIGEWLNGRVAVSKTVGCVFESRLPCQQKRESILLSLFCWQGYRDEYAATLLPSFVNLPSAISQYNINQNAKSYLNNSIIFE